MNSNDIADPASPDTIRIPFVFVPHGLPPPTDWLRDHPGHVRVPAVMVPRSAAEDGAADDQRPDIPGDDAATPAADAAAPFPPAGSTDSRPGARPRSRTWCSRG